MAKSGVRPKNGPSTTGRPSGGGRGNNLPSKPASNGGKGTPSPKGK